MTKHEEQSGRQLWAPSFEQIYFIGWHDGRASVAACHCVHPAIADSVRRIFPNWDGAEAATARKAAEVRSENQQHWHQKRGAA